MSSRREEAEKRRRAARETSRKSRRIQGLVAEDEVGLTMSADDKKMSKLAALSALAAGLGAVEADREATTVASTVPAGSDVRVDDEEEMVVRTTGQLLGDSSDEEDEYVAADDDGTPVVHQQQTMQQFGLQEYLQQQAGGQLFPLPVDAHVATTAAAQASAATTAAASSAAAVTAAEVTAAASASDLARRADRVIREKQLELNLTLARERRTFDDRVRDLEAALSIRDRELATAEEERNQVASNLQVEVSARRAAETDLQNETDTRKNAEGQYFFLKNKSDKSLSAISERYNVEQQKSQRLYQDLTSATAQRDSAENQLREREDVLRSEVGVGPVMFDVFSEENTVKFTALMMGAINEDRKLRVGGVKTEAAISEDTVVKKKKRSKKAKKVAATRSYRAISESSSSDSSKSRSEDEDVRLAAAKEVKETEVVKELTAGEGEINEILDTKVKTFKIPKVPEFNGKNFEGFMYKFDAQRKQLGWGEDTAVFNLEQALTGDAMRVLYQNNGKVWTLKRLQQALLTRFGINKSAVTVLNEMSVVRRGAKESLQEFADKIVEMSLKAPLTDERRARETRAAFVQGLQDDLELQHYIDRHDKDKTSLQRAVEIAFRYERQHGVSRNVSRFDNTVGTLHEEVDAFQGQQTGRTYRKPYGTDWSKPKETEVKKVASGDYTVVKESVMDILTDLQKGVKTLASDLLEVKAVQEQDKQNRIKHWGRYKTGKKNTRYNAFTAACKDPKAKVTVPRKDETEKKAKTD